MGDICLFLPFTPLMNKNTKVAAVCLAEERPRRFALSARAGGERPEIAARAPRSCTRGKRHRQPRGLGRAFCRASRFISREE